MRKKSHRGYDFLSPVYDALVRIVFHDQLDVAQRTFLHVLSKGQKVLIVGGGSGKILEAIDQLNMPLEVTFLDASEKMIKRASSRILKNIELQFTTCRIESFQADGNYDVLITPFFLDLFEGRRLKEAIEKLAKTLTQKGIWLVTDFQPTGKLTHMLLSKVMYVFFKITTRIKAWGLSDYFRLISEEKMILKEVKTYRNGFIKSGWYVKNG